MKQITLLPFLLFAIFFSDCKSKEAKKEGFFPILSFIKSQAAHVDTSLFLITKLTSVNSLWDTSYIKREEFISYAKDFLTLPDLAEKGYANKYEESKFFDATLNRVIITYTPKDKSEEIQREEVTIAPGEQEGSDKVKNIIVNKLTVSGDSSVVKRLLWTVDESFQVTTIIQKPAHADSIRTMKITWQ